MTKNTMLSTSGIAASAVLFLSGFQLFAANESWTVDTQAHWTENLIDKEGLDLRDGFVSASANTATFRSKLKSFAQKRRASSISISQSPIWKNWKPIENIGPSNLGDAPVLLNVGPDNYWIFGRYRGRKGKAFVAAPAEVEGFEEALKTTPYPNQYDAPGGLKESAGGYHAWQSRNMVDWVHHGPVSDTESRWMTTAECVDGKVYFYYDFPNDQDPHLIIDEDLTDGRMGKKMGMALKDPSHGSDCGVIRDLDGNFHIVFEDWSPIDASTHGWDSPLAGHAISQDGIRNFEILEPAIDQRTNPTGKFAEYPHPHWFKDDPENYPGKSAPVDVPQHRIKAGQIRAFGKYEIHEPEQNAFGDWASIAIGGQYYLFGDFDPATGHGRKSMSVAWFTSSSINEPFTFCGNIGQGHPDPDIMFAKGQFYLVTQMATDYVSPGPWVDGVDVRVGVDVSNNGAVDEWTDWQAVSESYDTIPGFSKQVSRTPARLDLSSLPAGYGFQFEVRLTDTTENDSKPILDKITLTF